MTPLGSGEPERGVAAPGAGRLTVLVVDDEPTITEVVSRYLRRAGYRTETAADGAEAIRVAGETEPDLVVLDLMLPRVGGLDVMRQLRERDRANNSPPVPVILLTARGEETDRVTGLRLGADDYMVKPFFPEELVARIETVLRRTVRPPDPPTVIECDDLAIDGTARRVWVNGREVVLTVREFDLLFFLAGHPGQVFSRDQLMDAVWQYSFYSDTSTVTVHIRRLRAKIEADPAASRHLQTVWGVGYRFEP